jgi:AbrB family looped-hinge helix DNA binding protein
MRTTIDTAGRVVVPKPIRERLQLAGGSEVDIEEREGIVEIRPVVGEIDVVETPQGPVAVSREPGPALTDEVVRTTLERVRG